MNFLALSSVKKDMLSWSVFIVAHIVSLYSQEREVKTHKEVEFLHLQYSRTISSTSLDLMQVQRTKMSTLKYLMVFTSD